MNIFNPEHDLCLANGDPNFVPPESALKFGRDCAGLTSLIETGEGIIPWGWDAVLKRRLLREGIPETMLPDDAALARIRELSNRKNAVAADSFIRRHLQEILSGRSFGGRPYTDFLTGNAPVIAESVPEVVSYVGKYGNAVAKAPWSGSGKGLRWLRAGELSDNDLGWCRNVIAKQGAVEVECREKVVRDFAMLFHISHGEVRFEGFSMFFNENGMYRGNVLASDGWILGKLSGYVPEAIVLAVKDILTEYFLEEFAGSYEGYAGVDMFMCRVAEGRFRLSPCVEINVRMTMGLLARRLHDRYPCEDGMTVMRVEYSPVAEGLAALLKDALQVLTAPGPDANYALAIFRNNS